MYCVSVLSLHIESIDSVIYASLPVLFLNFHLVWGLNLLALDYSSYTLISCCACVIYYLVRSFNKMAAERESSACGSSTCSRKKAVCWKYFEKVCTVKIAVKRRLSLKLVVSFVGRSSHTME